MTWDILTLGHFDLGRFDFGTKMFAISSLTKYSENILGTFWQITWDVLVLGRFDQIPIYIYEFRNLGRRQAS